MLSWSLKINKLLLLHPVGLYIIFLHRWCTVKQISNKVCFVFRRIVGKSFVPIFVMNFEKLVNRMQERKPFWDWRVKLYDRKDAWKNYDVKLDCGWMWQVSNSFHIMAISVNTFHFATFIWPRIFCLTASGTNRNSYFPKKTNNMFNLQLYSNVDVITSLLACYVL